MLQGSSVAVMLERRWVLVDEEDQWMRTAVPDGCGGVARKRRARLDTVLIRLSAV